MSEPASEDHAAVETMRVDGADAGPADGPPSVPGDDATLRSVLSDRRLVAGIAAATVAGLVVRLWYLLEFKRHDGDLTDEGDALYYGFQAIVNARGNFFEHPFTIEPAADHPPVTSLLLTPVALLTGDRIAPLRLTMTLLGVGTVAAIGLVAAVVATRAGWSGPRRRTVAVTAAAIAAVNANLWMNDPLLMSEGPGALVAAVLLGVATHQWGRPSARGAIALGVALGVGVLTRAEFGLFALLIALPLYLRAPLPARDRVARLALCAAVSIGVVAPWFAWNLTRFEEPVLVSTNDGLTLVGANCPEAYDGPAIGFWLLQCGTDDTPVGDQSERSRAWRQEGLDHLTDNLDRLPVVVAARVGRTWAVFEPRQTVFFNVGEGREAFASWIGLWQVWLLAPVAAAGWLVLRRSRASTVPLTATVVQATLTSALFYGIVRFRIAADVAMCVLAAVAVGAAAERAMRWATEARAEPDRFTLGHRPGLDGLRALAVVAVVAFHLDWEWFAAGFLGVDLFFVLSGFLITALLLEEQRARGAVSLRRFWARRALRLLPAIVTVVVAVNAYALVWEDAGVRRRLLTDSLATLLYVANWKLVADDGFLPELLDHTWSLSIEEQFYVAWPLVFVAVVASVRRRMADQPDALARAVVVVAGTGAVLSLGARAALSLTSTDDLAYYATVARADGILAGVALAGAVHAWPGALHRVPARAGTAAIVAFTALVVLGDRGRWFDVIGVATVSAVTAAAIAAVLVDRAPALLHHPALVAVGRRSYGLYLWHWPVFLILRPSRVTDLTWWQLDLLRIAVAAVLTWASYRFVEQPFLEAKGRFRVDPSPPTVGARSPASRVVSVPPSDPSS